MLRHRGENDRRHQQLAIIGLCLLARSRQALELAASDLDHFGSNV